MKLMTYKKA